VQSSLMTLGIVVGARQNQHGAAVSVGRTTNKPLLTGAGLAVSAGLTLSPAKLCCLRLYNTCMKPFIQGSEQELLCVPSRTTSMLVVATAAAVLVDPPGSSSVLVQVLLSESKD
jgi:hypothetical protein